jgi:hypothetical protein
MIFTTQLAPRNSVVVVMDQAIGEVPDSLNRGLVAATNSSVAVGTLCEFDGDTLISLSDERPRDLPAERPVFDNVIRTPSQRLSVCSVLDEALLVLDLPTTVTRVRIWANDHREPSRIWIVAGDFRV